MLLHSFSISVLIGAEYSLRNAPRQLIIKSRLDGNWTRSRGCVGEENSLFRTYESDQNSSVLQIVAYIYND